MSGQTTPLGTASRTFAQQSLDELKQAIKDVGPEFEMEVKYVDERMAFLMQRYGQAAIFSVMKAALQISVDKKQ